MVLLPALGLELRVAAAFDAQEFRSSRGTGIDYWEGAVEVKGTVAGRGFLELAGYAGGTLRESLR